MALIRTDKHHSLDISVLQNAWRTRDESVQRRGAFRTLDKESNFHRHRREAHRAGKHALRAGGFLTTDGEKPDRNRDTEFESTGSTRAELMDQWNGGLGIWVFTRFEPALRRRPHQNRLQSR